MVTANQAIVERLQRTLNRAIQKASELPSEGRLLVGVSGGADSLCLLHALRQVAPGEGLAVYVAHLDHGLRQASADEAAWVRALCADWGLPCLVRHVNVRALAEEEGRSLEDAARQARYRFLAQQAEACGARTVAVGHTADDQAETVLLHLLRGAGAEGLAGMKAVSDWPLAPAHGAHLRLWRPWLAIARQETVAYCAAVGLTPRDDETNRDTGYRRNYVRRELLPRLREINPAIVATLCRTAQILSDEDALLRELTDKAWQTCAERAEGAWRLDRDSLRAQPVGLQRRLLRRAVSLLGTTRDLSWEQIEQARGLALDGETGARAMLPHGLQLRIAYDGVWIEREGAAQLNASWPVLAQPKSLVVPGEIELGGGWHLSAILLGTDDLPVTWDSARDRNVAYFDADALGAQLLLRTRRPGDRIAPLGMDGRQKVSDLLIDAKVPAACRERLPLLTAGDEIIWVVGVRSARIAAITERTTRVCVLALTQVAKGEA